MSTGAERKWYYLRRVIIALVGLLVLGSAALQASAAFPTGSAASPPLGVPGQKGDAKADPWGVNSYDCANMERDGIAQQMNQRAGAILAKCSGAAQQKQSDAQQGSSGRTGVAAIDKLLAPLTGGVDKDTIVGETQNFLQSESWVWGNGNTVVVTFNDFRGLNLSPRTLCGASTSTDGGTTFTYLPVGVFGGLGNCSGDPFHYWSARANKWFAGFFSSACGANGIGQWESVDGINWTTSGCTHTGSNDDRFSGWVDNVVGSPFFGYQYVIFSNFSLTNGPLQAVRSTDDGVTWSAPVTLSARPGGGANRPVQLTGSPGTSGTVFAQSMDEGGGGLANRINYIHRTTDGGATWTQIQQGPAFPAPGSGTCPANTFFAIIPGPWRHQGWGEPGVGPNNVVHYAYAQHGAGADQGDIMYIRSTDNGTTWSAPLMLNTDAPAGTRAQWMPSLAVNAQGTVLVGWYDRRNTANNDYQRFVRSSTDNGVTWLVDKPISDIIIPQWVPDPNTAACYGGDYDYATASNSNQGTDFYQTWNDGRVIQGGVNQMNVFFDKASIVGGPTATGTLPTATRTSTTTNTPIPPSATATVCAFTNALTEGFESGTLGAFTQTVIITSTTTPVPTPGWASVASNPHSGTRSAFAPDPDRTTDSRLATTSNIVIPSGVTTATLSFWHRFSFENTFDGGVLEVSTDGGATWTDADANIQQGGYNGTITIFQGCVTAGTPPPFPAGKRVWTGAMTTYAEVSVNLLPYVNTNMRFRFRLGTDCSVSNTGWNIDDVTVSYGGSCVTTTITPPLSTSTRTSTVGGSTSTSTNTAGVSTSTTTRTNTPPAGATSTVCVPGAWAFRAPFNAGNIVRGLGIWYPPNGKFYVLGGRNNDTSGSDYRSPHEYDPIANTWITKTAVFSDGQVNNMAGGVLTVPGFANPVIVMVGGSAAGLTTATNVVRVYDPIADTLTTLGDNWPQAPTNATLPGGFAVHANKLYIIGGFNINVAMLNTIWEFDPTDPVGSRWTLKSSVLPVPMGYIPATTIGTLIFTGGGTVFGSALLTDTTNSYVFNPVGDSISPIPNIPRATGETRAVTVGGEMWVLGGGRTPPNPSNQVDIYNPGSGTWRVGIPFTTPRRNLAADSDGSSVFVAGGYTGPSPGTPINTLEMFTGGVCPSVTTTPQVSTATGTTVASTATRTATGTSVASTATRTATLVSASNTPGATATCTTNFRVLIAHGDCSIFPTTLRDQILAEGASVVDVVDAGVTTPSLAQMLTYNVVVVFNDCAYADPVALGDNLADYQDAGGVPVVFTFAWGNPSLAGRWQTGGYSPYNLSSGADFTAHTLGTYNAGHPLMQGITAGSLNAFYVNILTLATGATSEALWDNGQQLVAHKTTGGRTAVGVNAYVGDNAGQWSGPFGRIVMNAARWLVGGSCVTPGATNTPGTPATATPTACVANYSVAASTGATIVPGTTMLAGTNCDDCSVALALPFAFNFYGTNFNSVNVISNGNLQFSSTNTDFTNACEPYASHNNVIHAYWDDLLLTTAGDGVYTSVSGSAPNRIMNIEWRGCYYSGGSCGSRVSVEARLYEGSGRIDVIYATVGNGNVSATGGVQRGTGSLFLQAYCNGAGLPVTAGTMHTYTQGSCGSVTPSPTSPPVTITPQGTPTCAAGGTQVIQDPSFEGGTPNAFWSEESTNFGTPLCDVASCGNGGGTTGPRTGDWWAWFGGTASAEDGAVQQTVNIPAGGATLQFYLWIGAHSGNGTTDYIRALVNGVEVFRATDATTTYDAGYTLVSVDVSAQAGSNRIVRLEEHNDAGSAVFNASVDDVTLTGGGACVTPSVQPSVTSTSTSTGTVVGATNTTTSTSTATSTSTSTAVAPSATPTICVMKFEDVHPEDWFYGYVEWMYCNGIVSGYNTVPPCITPGRVCYKPGNPTTRGQLAKIAVRAFEFPIDTTGGPHFEDVPVGHTFYTYVETAYHLGLIVGYPCGSASEPCVPPANKPYYRPNMSVTRGQITKIMISAAILADPANWTLENPPTNTFQDVPVGSTFFRYIETAYSHHVIEGYPCGTAPAGPCVPPGNKPYFLPSAIATRAQIAKITYLAVTYPPQRASNTNVNQPVDPHARFPLR
jgi:hypothetical protein